MRILFVHQNFPGQFLHLAPALAARGHEVLALTAEDNNRPSPVKVMKYRNPDPVGPDRRAGRMYAEACARGYRAARAARQMRDGLGFVPDVIFGHSGWGETLFLKEVWPEARLLVYAELMYRTEGLDTGFDAEFGVNDLEARVSTVARSAHLVQAMVHADAALSPTRFQADTFPPELRAKITVCHDGVDTARLCPDPAAEVTLAGHSFRAGDEVITFVNRTLEPYRGYHIFMRALPEVLAARPQAHVLIIGAEGQSYGAAPPEGSWKQRFLAEVQGRLDLSRVHFLGRVPYETYMAVLRVGRVHAYLTYPFVLSWSLIEAMSMGAMVLGSDTGPVREVLRHGENGRLVDFFDTAAWSREMIAALADPAACAPLRAAARHTALAYGSELCLPRLIAFVEGAGRSDGGAVPGR